jgi:hypothetical protein
MYAVTGLILGYFEWRSAREIALLRLILSLFDVMLYKSRYGRMTHYLELKLDFMQAAFPHADSPPWLSGHTLEALAAATAAIQVVHEGGKRVRGLAVALSSGSRNMLYSVAHVVKEATLVTFKGETFSSPDFRSVTKGSDPLMAMKYVDTAICPDVE